MRWLCPRPPPPQAKPLLPCSTSFSCSLSLLYSRILSLFLSALRGIAIVGPFNKRFTRNSALRMTALGHCHRCRQLPACLPTHLPAPFTCLPPLPRPLSLPLSNEPWLLLLQRERFLCVPLSKIEFQIIFTALTRLAPRLQPPTLVQAAAARGT